MGSVFTLAVNPQPEIRDLPPNTTIDWLGDRCAKLQRLEPTDRK
jgi:hypothetical protein